MKLDLFRITTILDALDNPHEKLPPVIHIAGTNGKGSTAAFVRSILEHVGLKVHLFTSPHIERFNERIVLSGSEISDGYLYSILEECRIASEKNNIDVSFFEAITAAAFLAFSKNAADVTIIEVGLGARLDATNVIKEKLISIITPISFDHTEILGHSLKKIASEKMFVIKSNTPCVVSLQKPEVHKVIEDYAKRQCSPLIRFEYDFGVFIEEGLLSYKSDRVEFKINPPSLPGYHQYINAATAIATVTHLKGIEIKKEHIESGIANTKWKGRLQKITSGKLYELLPSNWEIILDAAHNESGAQSCSAWLENQVQMKTYLIIGMSRNRDIEGFIRQFYPLINAVVCVSIDHELLNYKAAELMLAIKDPRLEGIVIKKDKVEDAILDILSTERGTKYLRILITGSIFLLSDFFVSNRS